jgi:hypothetical protein
MTPTLSETYLVQVEFPLVADNSERVMGVAKKYSFSDYGFHGDTGMIFTFSKEPNARAFIRESRGLGFVVDIELLKDALEKLSI